MEMLSKIEKEVLNCLTENDEFMELSSLVKELDHGYETIKQALFSLIKKNMVQVQSKFKASSFGSKCNKKL